MNTHPDEVRCQRITDQEVERVVKATIKMNTAGPEGIPNTTAARLLYIAETLGVLPNNHFGGRKGQGTEIVMHALLEKIHNA
jgi:hypothetical protein